MPPYRLLQDRKEPNGGSSTYPTIWLLCSWKKMRSFFKSIIEKYEILCLSLSATFLWNFQRPTSCPPLTSLIFHHVLATNDKLWWHTILDSKILFPLTKERFFHSCQPSLCQGLHSLYQSKHLSLHKEVCGKASLPHKNSFGSPWVLPLLT